MIPAASDVPMNFGVYYELSAILISLVFLIHCYQKQGKWIAIKIFAVGLVYGIVLENGGPLKIPQLGLEGYFWEENYRLYLFQFFGHGYRLSQVPVATQVGWPMVFYVAYLLWDQICRAFPKVRERILLSGLIMASSGLLFDLPFDILATRFRWWVWSSNLKPIWFGVPLVNYVAWFWAVAVFGCFWVYFQNKEHWDDRTKTNKLMLFLPVMWILDIVGFMATEFILDALGLIYV